ncbi:helix-turn-helix transcriptional regulator [Streptomyces nanshensis]|uniref:HTH cro/C1-type domain-containing protein n=1 Tax=Streptomyces nanshensis TaxID=518642 RepID=A0A1E7L4E1_9ACTN|nr:helix-turn-helix transcriptional regulator [Streptomyces nanshensis]OEV11044.1 hypothetical protein AN218_14710 [Streptomyces nanshensis]
MEDQGSAFAGIDALLDETGPVDHNLDGLPPASERRRLRKAWNLSQDQVAEKVGRTRPTISAWEKGKEGGKWDPDPGSPERALYVHLLTGIKERLKAREAARTARPCVLCGELATDEVEGYPQHLDPAECNPAGPVTVSPAAATAVASPGSAPADATPGEDAGPAPSSQERPARARRTAPTRRTVGSRRVKQSEPSPGERYINDRVREVLTAHGGDAEAAIAELEYEAIPDAMHLLETSRDGGRYDFTYHAAVLPDIFTKKPGREGNDIWEARPKWSAPEHVLPHGESKVTALDINGAYLSALKAHLPIGTLEHHLGPAEGGPAYDKRRSGVHLITPPDWHHDALPNPLGNREEPGQLWVTESTLRLLHRCTRDGLSEEPLIHESWTSGESENLLETLRKWFATARKTALENGDEVTEAYVKAMYSKFVSTMGHSNYNRHLYRQDWVHILRSQAFGNLWGKAYKAHQAGLTVVGMLGTDELHVIGDWRAATVNDRPAFVEGRDVAQVKIKDTYTITGPEAAHA